jgi:hypothetical protein
MPLALNDVVAVALRGTLFGQRILTLLHYQLVSTSSAVSAEGDLQNIANKIQADFSVPGTMFQTLLDCQTSDYLLESVRAQRISPTRTVYMETLAVLAGTNAGACNTPNLAACVSKRTAVLGRHGSGKVMVAGIPDNGITAGEFTPAYIATLQAFANQMPANLTVTAGTLTLRHGLFNPGPVPGFSGILEGIVRNRVSTMHRRTKGVGE